MVEGWRPTGLGWDGYGVETRIVCWAARWMVVHVLCFDWIYVWLEGCVTGLPDCWPGCGYDLADRSVGWMAMGGGFLICTEITKSECVI